ncbi:uncharacterized protein LOC115626381 isoform X2 [Scaptodrosophila lebanonensis]|uniref:Uncharacterized protein LOC115626381 isoform X2 n=1 Tax=Drosophila lebanonensis TaxID=7225 RepID=A0A6J2TQ13_DROLE|nr:uncharacterized protein LOC115626381 isoform X2 [Scaptodrosophila lebanonensis]
MTDSFKLAEMHRTNIDFERRRHLANWLVNSSPHMAAAAANATAGTGTTATTTGTPAPATTTTTTAAAVQQGAPGNSAAAAGAAACNGTPSGGHHARMTGEGRKPKRWCFTSHDTSSNMFSVSDFENARLARRNENELKQRLARRLLNNANGSYGLGAGYAGYNNFCGGLNGSGDYSTGDSKASKCSSEEPLPADVFLSRYSLPRVVRLFYVRKQLNETLQSSSSHGSSTAASSSSSVGLSKPTGNNDTATNTSSSGGSAGAVNSHNNNNNNNNNSGTNSTQPPTHDELFLLYRLVRQRLIYHCFNAKSQASQRKKSVLIPQEFTGYFSMLNDKGLPMATQYTSLMQLVRECVYKFVSVDNMAAYMESPPSASSPTHEGCLPSYTTAGSSSKNRPQYVKTTARGGHVFKLLAVFEDGKQEQNGGTKGSNASAAAKAHGVYTGREKEKGRYAQLQNENRQVIYVPMATKGKFYEIEPGVPQLLQKVGQVNRKLNPECVYRLGSLVSAAEQLPLTLRYISGPSSCAHDIPEQVCVSHVSKEDVVIGCPIEDVEVQGPLQLRKLYLTKEMQLMNSFLGFDGEQRMLANTNVQNMLKFCQFNCDQFLKLVEIEQVQRPERSGSKSRVDGLKILHLPKLLRREKTTIPAHEKEDSIIFLSKTDLEQLEAKEAASSGSAAALTSVESGSSNCITDRMKVFQTKKKKLFFRKQEKQRTELELDVQAKRMSMERYTDMSKLLQERFGDACAQQGEREHHEHEAFSLHSAGTSEVGCSDTETTTLTAIERALPKSLSLQDIELLNGQRKPDLLTTHHTSGGDAISEAGTELEDLENQTPPRQSFITEKLFNEFHVKTRQYSKSSSSLHQLLNFSLPQKMQLHEKECERRKLSQHKAQQQSKATAMTEFNIGEPVTGRRAAGGVSLLGGGGLTPSFLLLPSRLVEDDLPYSNVRDSLVISNNGTQPNDASGVRPALPSQDYTKENIYAEICHENSANGMRNSRTCDTFSGATQLTSISKATEDDDGDYASLRYPSGPQSVSRVEINGSAASAISYHTVYLGEEPLGERHATAAAAAALPRDRVHITTVELAGDDNIYNTLK